VCGAGKRSGARLSRATSAPFLYTSAPLLPNQVSLFCSLFPVFSIVRLLRLSEMLLVGAQLLPAAAPARRGSGGWFWGGRGTK